MDLVPIDKAAQAHSIAIPNSPKYAVGSTGFHFSSPRSLGGGGGCLLRATAPLEQRLRVSRRGIVGAVVRPPCP